MGYVEGNCPKCGTKIREKCNAWVYGSPIRTCPSCQSEFLDKRFREVAIGGFDPRANNPKFYLFGFFWISGIYDCVRRMADRYDKCTAKLSGKISGVYCCRNRRYSGMCGRFITADDRI